VNHEVKPGESGWEVGMRRVRRMPNNQTNNMLFIAMLPSSYRRGNT